MKASISLLVLLFSMCGAQTRSTQTEVQTESQSTGAAAAAAAEVSTQLDVSAELKELREMVVELRVMLRYTQDDLKVVEERLGISEIQSAVLMTRLAASEAEVIDLKKENEALSADLRSVAESLAATKSDVENLEETSEKSKVAFSAAQSADLRAAERLSATKAELENMEKTSETSKVAFSAGLPSGYTQAGHNELDLVFSEVITNAGHGYDSSSGFFKAPVSGVYYFRFTVRDDISAHSMYISMYKNDQRLMQLNEYDTDGKGTYLSSGLTLQLEVGDVVNLRLPAGDRLYNDVHNHSTFSGVPLFPL
ncbi:hypothetical protein ACEWY4_020755 [Coilia grayii]|uniref:C1q domain-containing protein n=1 Tax=Coilia grayii TaxID=363190 RepID=A0ABD1J707_9TELE